MPNSTKKRLGGELLGLTPERQPCSDRVMVNSQDAASSRTPPNGHGDSHSLTATASLARNTNFDGTKLPLVVQTSRNHYGMYSCPTPTRNMAVMLIFWAAFRTVGDKIELTVTIVAREHHHHGR